MDLSAEHFCRPTCVLVLGAGSGGKATLTQALQHAHLHVQAALQTRLLRPIHAKFCAADRSSIVSDSAGAVCQIAGTHVAERRTAWGLYGQPGMQRWCAPVPGCLAGMALHAILMS